MIILHCVIFLQKDWNKKDKKEELFKRLKRLKLKAIKSKNENIKEVSDFVEETLSLKTKALIEEIRSIQKKCWLQKIKNYRW